MYPGFLIEHDKLGSDYLNSLWVAWYRYHHGLRTPNEGINQIYLKSWADVADKICFGRTYQFRIGS